MIFYYNLNIFIYFAIQRNLYYNFAANYPLL